jgi:hypothetical protein
MTCDWCHQAIAVLYVVPMGLLNRARMDPQRRTIIKWKQALRLRKFCQACRPQGPWWEPVG